MRYGAPPTLTGELEVELGEAGASNGGTAATLAGGFDADGYDRPLPCG